MSKWRPGKEGASLGRRTRLQPSLGQRDVHAGPPRACQVLAWAGGGLGWLHPCPRGGRGSGWLPQGSGTLSRSPRCGVSSTCSSPGPARGLASLLVPCPSPASWALPPWASLGTRRPLGAGGGGPPSCDVRSGQVRPFWAAGSSQVTPGLVHTGQLTPHNPNSGRGRAVPRLQGLGLQAREHGCGGPQSS